MKKIETENTELQKDLEDTKDSKREAIIKMSNEIDRLRKQISEHERNIRDLKLQASKPLGNPDSSSSSSLWDRMKNTAGSAVNSVSKNISTLTTKKQPQVPP